MMISDGKRRDFEDRKLDNVRRQVAHANFAPDKHKQAQEWIDEQEHRFGRERNAIARSANRIAGWKLVIAVGVLLVVVPLAIRFWGGSGGDGLTHTTPIRTASWACPLPVFILVAALTDMRVPLQ